MLPKTVGSDRPIALLTTQFHWWDWVRADVMEYWKQNPVEWDAPVNEAGGARWEALWELEPNEPEGPKNPATATMLTDLQQGV